jgi:hypothetical protein
MRQRVTLTLTASELRQLGAARYRRHLAARRERTQAIARTRFGRLGTDNPWLLLREIAYASAATKAEHSGNAARFAQWCDARALHDDANECRADAATDLADAKVWARRFIALSDSGERMTRRLEALTVRAELCEIVSRQTSIYLPTPLAEPLALHQSAQAPPKSKPTANIRGAASAFSFTQRKAVKN